YQHGVYAAIFAADFDGSKLVSTLNEKLKSGRSAFGASLLSAPATPRVMGGQTR
ncbi:hypothetical protein EJB05_02304, partial [Eragrostis curvula]